MQAREPTKVISVRVTERMAAEIDRLAEQAHMSVNGVAMMLLSQGLRSPELRAAFRVHGSRK